jgi:hypothetical protein
MRLRVIIYKDETGASIFEYDRPSSLFGQYGDERVTEVGRYLDAALEGYFAQCSRVTVESCRQLPAPQPQSGRGRISLNRESKI